MFFCINFFNSLRSTVSEKMAVFQTK